MNETRRVAVVGGVRTPFVKAGGVFRNHIALELGIHAVDSLVQRFDLSSDQIQELAYGTVLLDPSIPNAAREVVFRSQRLSSSCGAHFLSNNCITGLVAVSWIFDAIRAGRINCGIAAGAESMSANLASQPPMVIKEPSTGLTIGEHCELMAKEFEISREEQDKWAYESHMSAWKNYAQIQEEIVSFNGVDQDNVVRPKINLEGLARLKPVFDKKSGKGTLTAGNSSPLTDGASAVCLMGEDSLKGHEPLAYIKDIEFSAVDPADGLLMAPTLALARLLKRNAEKVDMIDIFEFHEAFSAQVLANLLVWRKGWEKYSEVAEIGEIPREKINPNGSSLALGHPFAATGGRLVTAMAHQFRRSTAELGVIAACAGGGMGCAVLMSKN